jgi:hypothetical protein
VDPRQRSDAVGALFRDANGEEATEAAPAVWDAERAVPRANQPGRRFEDLFQHPVEIEVAGDRQRRIVDGREPALALRRSRWSWTPASIPHTSLRSR